jgi:hypothetical protein
LEEGREKIKKRIKWTKEAGMKGGGEEEKEEEE